MGDSDITGRAWVVDIIPDEVRLRCSYRRRRKRIVQFTVQLEVYYSGQWQPIVRYDNAHGFCHRDTIHRDGSQEKTPVYYGDANDTFTHAVGDLRSNWGGPSRAFSSGDRIMIDLETFAQRQMELAAEFAKYVLDHPDVDASLPEDAYIYFQVDGESEFNEYSQQLAERREREEGVVVVCVRLKGLAPPQGSRLIDPQIIPSPNVA